jgi:hypothetical protein
MKEFTMACKTTRGLTLTIKMKGDTIEQVRKILEYMYPRYTFKEI